MNYRLLCDLPYAERVANDPQDGRFARISPVENSSILPLWH